MKHDTFSARCWCKPKIEGALVIHNRVAPPLELRRMPGRRSELGEPVHAKPRSRRGCRGNNDRRKPNETL